MKKAEEICQKYGYATVWIPKKRKISKKRNCGGGGGNLCKVCSTSFAQTQNIDIFVEKHSDLLDESGSNLEYGIPKNAIVVLPIVKVMTNPYTFF